MPPEDTYSSPGIYIEPGPSFRPQIPFLPTSVPVFIVATGSGHNLMQKTRVSSLLQYRELFGTNGEMSLQMELYFVNGGGECYVINAGADTANLLGCIDVLRSHDEATLLVVPQMASLPQQQYSAVIRAMLRNCAHAINRFALIDVLGGWHISDDIINAHRQQLGDENLRYGASYIPYLIVEGFEHPVASSAAIAGIFCRVDRERGIWKAPANVAVIGITGLTVTINDSQQELLNVDPTTGKSINAIRQFSGRGNLLWGARTLAGNENDWKYISVQRFYSWVKACVSTGLGHFVFEANDAGTWVAATGLIENFLISLWKSGALQGAKPQDAFFVSAGLGRTMNELDILEGRLIVEIGLAVVRPAEFVMMHIVQPVSIS